MRIRQLVASDFNKGFFQTLSHLRSTQLSYEKAKDVLARIHKHPGHYVFVVEVEGGVVATLTLLIEQKFIHNGGLVGHIEDVSTHPDHCGKGYGQALIKHSVEIARQEGCYKVILDCDDKNVRYYTEKCGFRRCANAMRIDLL